MLMESSIGTVPAPAWLVEHGVEIPTRVFVGNIPYETNDLQLKQFFSQFGKVTDCNIVTDRDGTSKGYGFVTFSCEEEARSVLSMESIPFNDIKELNISKAIRRQSSQQYSKANKEYIHGQKSSLVLPNHCQPGRMIYSIIPSSSPTYYNDPPTISPASSSPSAMIPAQTVCYPPITNYYSPMVSSSGLYPQYHPPPIPNPLQDITNYQFDTISCPIPYQGNHYPQLFKHQWNTYNTTNTVSTTSSNNISCNYINSKRYYQRVSSRRNRKTPSSLPPRFRASSSN